MERIRINLNNDWGFATTFEPDMAQADYDTGKLQTVRLPHTCQETPFHYFDESIYQMVSGYRKVINAPMEWQGKSVRLTFEGVGHRSLVYLNGQEIAEHNCGYTAFTVDLTDRLLYGQENVLAVSVDSRETLNVPPFGYVIDYMTYGGIYREVYLEITSKAYIEDVFVSSAFPKGPKTGAGSEAELCTQISLAGIASAKWEIKQSFCKKGAAATAALQNTLSKDADQGNNYVTKTVREPVKDIELWDVEHPALYELVTELYVNGEKADEVITSFGFREIAFQTDGFYLNGRKLRIRGLNRHQSYPYVGYAMPESMQKLDADILKQELGVNAVRTSHYPQSHHFLNRCDEIGLLVFTEMPGWQHIGDESWKEQAVQNTKDMVLQYRNHPSIIMWGVRINESVDDDVFYAKTNEAARALDPTRPTGGVRAIKKSNLLEDVYTYNDFVHEGNNKGCEPKRKVTSNGKKPYLVSEYNGHMYPTKAFDCEEHRVEHALRHANVLNAIAGEEDIAGSFGWCMFDYNTHKDFGSGDRICYHGVMDMFRNPKTAAAVYQSQQEETPVLSVSSSMDIGEHPGCNRGLIYLFTNADSVRMYKNDEFIREYSRKESPYQKLPYGPIVVDDFVGDVLTTKEHMKPAQAKAAKKLLNTVARQGLNHLPLSAIWNAAKLIGIYHMNFDQATVLYNKYVGDWGGESTKYRFEAIKNGELVKTVIKEPMHTISLLASADHTVLKEKETYDVASIRIRAVDENGNVLSVCNDPVQIEAEGAIELIGPKVLALQGGMSGAYVKSKGENGTGTLKVTLAGGHTITLRFEVQA